MQGIGKARRQIVWSENSSEPSEITNDGVIFLNSPNDEVIFQNATSVGENVPLPKPNSDHGIVLNVQLWCNIL